MSLELMMLAAAASTVAGVMMGQRHPKGKDRDTPVTPDPDLSAPTDEDYGFGDVTDDD